MYVHLIILHYFLHVSFENIYILSSNLIEKIILSKYLSEILFLEMTSTKFNLMLF